MQYYCKTCNRTMDSDQFYTSHRVDKYPPDGHFNECKKCLTRHVNNYDPETYLWILQEADVPYIEDEWTSLLVRYGKDRSKLNGTTIIGRYLSKMKLVQYRNFRWDDTQRLKELAEEKRKETMTAQGYTEQEIADSMSGSVVLPKTVERPPDPPAAAEPDPIDLITPEYFNDDLTEEDRKYLSIKWGRAYKPYEWVQLEQYYTDMFNAFDIQTPAHIDYLKLICKTSLKCHQLLDLGDIESFQKVSRTYDMLMKSSKFTAAQNKMENGEYVDSIGEIVRLAEQEGFIPRYYTDKPQDKVDETLRDMRGYVDTLVRDELNLGNLIENAVRTMAKEEEKEEDAEVEDEVEEEDIFDEHPTGLTDADFEEHYKFLEHEKQEDAQTFADLLGGDEK